MDSNNHTADDAFAPSASITLLRKRAELLRRVRAFFDDQGFLEVETPILSSELIPETHIEPISVASVNGARTLWLQASPEAHMKRLLAAGAPSLYQITRSFRAGERGALHNPEFTMVEWYALGDDMDAGVDRLDAFLQSVLNAPPATRTTYRSAFLRYAGVDPFGPGLSGNDEELNRILVASVEANLGRIAPEVIMDFPPSQAALARVRESSADPPVAERFEVYWRGVELANGYHELTDSALARARFETTNALRRADARPTLPLPERFLAAMDAGIPRCSGVALGFDRLVMLATGATHIDEVIAFPFGRA